MATRLTIPAGAPELYVDEYLKHMQSNYLHSYIPGDGSSVKFVVTDSEPTTEHFVRELDAEASGHDYLVVDVQAEQTRLQFVEELFFAISRQVDWVGLAARFLQQVYREVDIPAPKTTPVTEAVRIRSVAEANGLHAGELYRTVRRSLERLILADPTLLRQFAVAMLRLCHSLLDWSGSDAGERDIVLRWLHGRSVPVAQLRTIGLPGRIGRHHARFVFASLTNWVRMAGRPGTVVTIDLARVGVSRRPAAAARRGFYYSKAAALDTFEVLRQFVDATDDLRSTLLVVCLPKAMAADGHRGLPAYHALYLRVADDVYDQTRANPMGCLVRVVRR